MIALTVIESYPFLSMPLSAQALYMHLIANADDDGIVEAYRVMLIVQAKPDDLQILIAKRFAMWLDECRMIMYLNDWLIQNKIRASRYHPSIYQPLLRKIYPMAIGERQTEEMSNVDGQCQTDLSDKIDAPVQSRLGQVRLGQQQQDIKTGTNIDQEKNVLMMLSSMGCKDQQALALIRDYGVAHVKVQLQLLAHQGNIRNPMGWLLAAIKGGYVDPAAVKEEIKVAKKEENERIATEQIRALSVQICSDAQQIPSTGNITQDIAALRDRIARIGGDTYA